MKKLLTILVVLLLSLCFCINAVAVSEPIDLERTAQLSVTMECSHGYKCGGNVAIYYIASIEWAGSNYVFKYTDDFKDCNIPLENISDDKKAEKYSNYVIEKGIVVDRKILVDGTVVVKDLPLGLYMVVHEDPDDGFSAALPFLATLPTVNGDYWEYEVDATTKVELKHYEVIPPPDIPQSGQLKWPVPVLACLGVLVFAIGCALCFRKRYS